MSRPPRVLFADRVAHCSIHAVDGMTFCREDIEVFLQKLRMLRAKHHFIILGYSFMLNHVHLMMKFSEDISCGRIMCIIDGCLSKAFNRLNKRKGHLWRERYYDVSIQEETHFWAAFLYITLNKLKANIVKSPDGDISSSYRYYAYGEEDFITTPAQEYIELGSTADERQTEFRAMVQESWERFCEAQEWEHIDDEEETLVAKGRVDLKKLVAMSDFEDEYLEKLDQRDKELNRDSNLFTQDALDAMTVVRERQASYLRELMSHLLARGIPARVVRQFWACEEFIIDFVESHRQYFGLSGPT